MIQVIGAGMAGLLAAGMLRQECEGVLEAQGSLPNNHTALLRFRSSVVGDTLNIPFSKVRVMKAVEGGLNPIAAALSYSLKSNGTATLRSSISAAGDIEERWIAPPDLISRMADIVGKDRLHFGVNIENSGYFRRNRSLSGREKLKYISTIPMPSLMRLLAWDDCPEFEYVSGYNVTAILRGVDACVTLYIPDRLRQENRISLTRNKLTIEIALPRLNIQEVNTVVASRALNENWKSEIIQYALDKLGLFDPSITATDIQLSPQRYAKILPIDESIRRSFIIWASEEHGIFSLGRFATWRPGLLLDDVVNDVQVIQNLIRGRGAYDQRKKG